MTTTVVALASGCRRALKRVWFLIPESDPPEKPKTGIRIFGPAPPRTTGVEAPPARQK
ncbi:hypothetical protein ACVW0Y_001150 [Pseudomonas sp. TE3786]